MPHDSEPQAAFAHHSSEPDLPDPVERACQALQSMVASLDGLDRVILGLKRLGPPVGQPTKLMADTLKTVSSTVALLRREGPPLLSRIQALRQRLNGPAAGGPAIASATRMLHADLDGLAAFLAEDAVHWDFILRRLRSNTTLLLADLDDQRRGLTGPHPRVLALPQETTLAMAG